MAPPISAFPSIRIVLKALRSIASDIALRMSGLSNGGLTRLTIRLDLRPGRDHLADRVRRLRLDVLHQGNADIGREGDVEFAGRESEHAGRAAVDHPESDLVEIGAILFPVIGIAHQTDRVAALEFDELERPGADRLRAHHRLRNVARINDRKCAREQHQQAGLRLAQFERGLVIAVGRDVLQLGVPDLARVPVKVLRLALADQHPPGALHVLRRERLAVMPFHALPQLEGQFGVGRIPGPAFGEIRDDGVDALVRPWRDRTPRGC